MAKRPPARFDPPMPIAPIRNATALASCGGGIYRAVIALAVAYWSGACRELPQDEVTLATMARLPLPRMREVKNECLAAMDEITPHLAFAYAVAKQRHIRTMAHMRDMAAKSSMTGRLAHVANGGRKFAATPQTATMPVAPRREQPYRTQDADMPALRELAKRQRANVGPRGLLKDNAASRG